MSPFMQGAGAFLSVWSHHTVFLTYCVHIDDRQKKKKQQRRAYLKKDLKNTLII